MVARLASSQQVKVQLLASALIVFGMELKILERTFGLEIEYADLDKHNVYLPAPYTWDEEEVIHNTDGTRGTVSARYGGEINTPPMKLCHADLDTLKLVVDSCRDNGAVARRDCGVQVHIFVGDLEVEELKRIYFLSYYTTNILKELCMLPPYCDEQHFRRSPETSYFLRVCEAKSFSDLEHCFESNHNKGFIRHFVNISSYFVRKTVEFRIFNSTTDFNEMVRCIMFAYRFVDYALKHDIDDFKTFTNVADFVKRTKVPTDLPKLPHSLIFFSSVRRMDVSDTNHKSLALSNPMMSLVLKNTGARIVCVNPQLYSTEVRLSATKSVVVFCNDEFNNLLFDIVRNGVRITYDNRAKWLQDYNGDSPVKQIACLLVFKKVQLLFRDSDFHKRKLEAIINAMEKTIERATRSAERIVKFLESCEYHLGTLNDAIAYGGEIFFQFDDYSKNNTAMGALRRHSDYDGSFSKKRTHYLNVTENLPEGTSVLMFSDFAFHESMMKIGKVGYHYLYSTKPMATKMSRSVHKKNRINIIEPPNDLVIDDASKLKIIHVNGETLRQAQEVYVQKVEAVTTASFPFLVYYDKYLLGGLGFNFTKHPNYDIWLLSDFCTNNQIPRLSKLILLCVKSKEVKRMMCRILLREISTCYTKVYTHKPVSMKYRGMFKKVSVERNHLLYETLLGSSGSISDVVKKYNDIISKMK